ncbi:CDP-alcohol phosphatidyltransferase family protein [Paenibacillus amylolyticus]|nr:CDP-alcohol phosphatidyltransferase family protein [Paenibacillus amylolyticus]
MKSLPSILTLGNLSSGMLAVIMAIHGEFALAVMMIWVAMFFDLFDGFAARKLHCEGEFGKSLDSLADVVSFGTAPVLILYLNSMLEVSVLGMALTALFPICRCIASGSL